MKHVSVLLSIGIYLSLARAAPTTFSRDVSGALISTQCINTEYRQDWLIGDCLTGADATTRIKSGVFLPNKVENNDGSLDWKSDGEFQRSCKDCTLAEGGASLSCSCKTAWNTGKDPYITGILKLEEHIAVYNGHLLSDLAGPPSIPASSSEYDIPSDFTWSFGGLATCPDDADPPSDWCKGVANSCTTSTNRTDTRESVFSGDGPVTCFLPRVYLPNNFQFDALKWVGVGDWEVLGYGDEACTGAPVATLGPETVGICENFATRVKAVTVRPAFNGDPR